MLFRSQTSCRGGMHRREPQQIQHRDERLLHTKNQGRASSSRQVCTSSHMRFKKVVGQSKGRVPKPKSGAGRYVYVTGQRRSTSPTEVPQGIPRRKATRAETSGLVDVPIQLVSSPNQQPNCDGPILQHKRKPSEHVPIQNRPRDVYNRSTTADAKQARVDLNPEGFYHVQINRGHCERIGKGCGVPTEDVIQMIQTDNEERGRARSPQLPLEHDLQLGSEWEMEARFDPDPADELETEEEEC